MKTLNLGKLAVGAILVVCAMWMGCTRTQPTPPSTTVEPPPLKLEAPRGGTLVSLGGGFAHVEMVLDPETGKLTAYALDDDAEDSVQLAQKEMDFQITLNQGGQKKTFTMKLAAVPNVLTGETVGDTSQFEGQSDNLKGVKEFDAVLSYIHTRGADFKDVPFNVPKGNDAE
jgi:hypothetical protein